LTESTLVTIGNYTT